MAEDRETERKRRSRSRDRHYSRGVSPKRRRSRSRDNEFRRSDERTSSRRHETRRRSRSREHFYPDERDSSRYSRRRDDIDGRSRDDHRYHHRRDREDKESDLQDKRNTPEDSARDDDDQEEYLERVASQLAEQEEDVEKIKEESRKRRQAILEKYRQQQQQENQACTVNKDEELERRETTTTTTTTTTATVTVTVTTTVEQELAIDSGEGIFNPTTPLLLGKSLKNGSNIERVPKGGLGEGEPPKSEISADMFGDVFGESPAGGRILGRGDGLLVDTSGLNDNWDDADGYYTYRVGEVLDGRYEIVSSHGKGVFSTVVRARDAKASGSDPDEVAIKIIRNNETMFKAGQRELVILKKLSGADPENRRHCVRLLSSFEYRNHLCLVFESLHMNLREILKKFGRNIGLSLNAVHSYAKQLFIALKHLRNCGVLHCDIKPDNMLVNEGKNLLKLCDFGSAMFAGENEITPYLVSRFYRAPEIILGLPYDHALDMWSVGCCLYELFTGKVLFPGHTNNDMLRLHMELKGPFPKKMLKKAAFAHQHFDQDFNFSATEDDPVTKKSIRRIMSWLKPRDMGNMINGADEDQKMLMSFKHMMEKIFVLDPEKRLTVSQALAHPFITGK